MRMGTIYLMTHRATGKAYVGQTRQRVDKRWKEHFHSSRPCDVKFRELGYAAFDFAVLCIAPIDRLNILEDFWIQVEGTMEPRGLNYKTGGAFSPIVGGYVRQKMSKTRKGRKYSPEHCAAISAGKLAGGYRHSTGTRAKIAEARSRQVLTDETRAKMSVSNRAAWVARKASKMEARLGVFQ